MKKNILFVTTFALLATLFLNSCSDDETEGLSRVTYYALLEMNGSAYDAVQVGTTYNDPGCVATMAGEDVSDKIAVTGNVNTDKLGFYSLNYVVVNDDGFPASASRTVAVVDRNNFASVYYGESQYGPRHYYNAPISIEDNGDGTYTINDLAGGFYSYGRYPGYDAYGFDFFLETVLKLNADNSIEIVDQNPDDWYWGDAISITTGTYDAESGTITLVMDFSGTPMYVTLTK